MHRLVTLIFFAGCLQSGNLFAQSDKFSEAKIGLIKEAIYLYSTDPGLKHKPITSCDGNTVEELQSCAGNMTGVDKRIAHWFTIKADNKDALEKLKSTIVSDITNGRENRKKLARFAETTRNMDKIIANTDNTDAPAADDTPETAPATASMREQAQPQSQNAVSNHDSGSQKKVVTTPAAASSSGLPWGLSWWSILALVMAFLALFKAFMPAKTTNKIDPDSDAFISHETNEHAEKIKTLEAKLRKTEKRIKELEVTIQDAQTTFNNKLRTMENNVITATAPAAKPAPTAASRVQAPVTKFAKSPDGNGFPADALSDGADNKKIYEITIDGTGRQATYRVSANREAQVFALSNISVYLKDGCDYTSAPESLTSLITTTAPGMMELHGNRWIITSKAQIIFS